VFVAKLDHTSTNDSGSAKVGATSAATSSTKKCITKDLPIGDLGAARELAAQLTLDEPMLGNYLDHEFAAFHHITYAIRVVDVVVAARISYVRTVEDFLARRSRLLFLDARAAIQLAPSVATILQKELNWTNEEREAQLQSFIQLAQQYIIH
jgi:glycerol-3-phosphate dehydrogenase